MINLNKPSYISCVIAVSEIIVNLWYEQLTFLWSQTVAFDSVSPAHSLSHSEHSLGNLIVAALYERGDNKRKLDS